MNLLIEDMRLLATILERPIDRGFTGALRDYKGGKCVLRFLLNKGASNDNG